MIHTEYYHSLILLQLTGEAIHRRRKLEKLCSYPSNYGGDELLIKKIDEYFDNEDIKDDLREAHEYLKKHTKDIKQRLSK